MRLQSLAVSLSVFLIFLTPLEAYSGKKHKSGSSREQENCTEPVSSSQDLGCFCNGEGHLESLQILYTGDSCAASSHHQSTTGVQCSGDPKGAERVRILATTNESETHKQYAVSFDGEVSLDQAFHLNGTMTKHEKLSPTTYLYIYSLGGQLLQSVSFHTSCSQPLEIGDQFGSFVLQSGIRNSEILADGCGVCGGDGSSCVDCLGVPNGGAQVDACGVCNGNNACKDCEGTTNGSKTVDACGICGGDGSSCLDCEGVPFGTTNIDSCGVCGGNNTCVDCKGTTHGTAKLDSCGVCGGSNACLDCGGEACDCFGEIGGTAKVDSCGVCGGTDKCLDCAGTPFGTALLDACGECNGANTCLDCAGEPFGEAFVDRCGVCNGDGESCVNCTAVNLASVQGQLDGNGFAMKQLVLKAMKLF
ncbi:MAG: hypothetical protein KDD62_09290, partial [Bdellovibrionales bacterium]|nr:hypothetical protein [Bdellovibrionales bacterium]